MSSTYYESSYPPSLWEEPVGPADGRDSASPGDAFTDAAITAEDSANAAKLTPIGFVADPLTKWTVGQSMTVNTFRFYWTATAWAAGLAPTTLESPPQAPEGTQEAAEPPEGTGTAQEPPEAPEGT